MTQKLGVSFFEMAENAAREVGRLVRAESRAGSTILILAGPGGNGGTGLILARRLLGFGYRPNVILIPDAARSETQKLHRVLRKLGIVVAKNARQREQMFKRADSIVDALLGYHGKGKPRGMMVSLIERANDSKKNIIAIDLPSGLDADTGRAAGATIRAKHTMTIALPKKGLLKRAARTYTGTLWLCDVGIPPTLYKNIGVRVGALFAKDTLFKI